MTGAERAKLHAAVARVNLAVDRPADADLELPDWRPASPVMLDLEALKQLALEVSPSMHASQAGVVRSQGSLERSRLSKATSEMSAMDCC